MENLPNISNFCVVKVLGNHTSLVSTKSGHLCILKQYKFQCPVAIDKDLKKYLLEFKNIISSNLLLQIDYYFIHQDVLYIVFEYCEGGSVLELQQRITLYNDSLYDSELIEWFTQMIASINELIGKDILKYFDMALNSNCFYFKNNSIKLDTSNIVLNYVLHNIPELMIDEKTANSVENLHLEFGRLSFAQKSSDQKLLFHIACLVYELSTHKRINLFEKENLDISKIELCGKELPLMLQELFIRILKFEINFPDIMEEDLIKETLSQEFSIMSTDDVLIFNLDKFKYKENCMHEIDQSFDLEGSGLNQQDIAELIKDF